MARQRGKQLDAGGPESIPQEPVPTVVLEFVGNNTFRVTAIQQEPMNMWIRLRAMENPMQWEIRYAPAGRWTTIADPFNEILRWADAQTCGGHG